MFTIPPNDDAMLLVVATIAGASADSGFGRSVDVPTRIEYAQAVMCELGRRERAARAAAESKRTFIAEGDIRINLNDPLQATRLKPGAKPGEFIGRDGEVVRVPPENQMVLQTPEGKVIAIREAPAKVAKPEKDGEVDRVPVNRGYEQPGAPPPRIVAPAKVEGVPQQPKGRGK